MAEHALDNFDALALRDQLAAAGVAQLVRRIPRAAGGVDQASRLAELGPLVMDGFVRNPCAAFGAEQDVVV